MNQAKTTAAVLLTGLLAGAGVHAQTTGVVVVPADTTVIAPADATVITTTTEMGASASEPGRAVPHSSASVTSNVPLSAGEASTMTQGVPNMSTNNPDPDEGRGVSPRPMDIARVPQQAGEASTMVNGRPNWNPNDPMLQRQQERALGYGAPQPQPQPAPGMPSN